MKNCLFVILVVTIVHLVHIKGPFCVSSPHRQQLVFIHVWLHPTPSCFWSFEHLILPKREDNGFIVRAPLCNELAGSSWHTHTQKKLFVWWTPAGNGSGGGSKTSLRFHYPTIYCVMRRVKYENTHYWSAHFSGINQELTHRDPAKVLAPVPQLLLGPHDQTATHGQLSGAKSVP